MSHAVAVLTTLILTFIWSVQLETDIRKDYAKTGYIIIDKQAYRLVPVQP
jgi:hypothetical protein